MEEITLGMIDSWLKFVLAFGGSITAIYIAIKKGLDKGLKPTNDKIDNLKTSLTDQINKSDMNSTKNFLVARLSEIKSNSKLDDITMERFWEQYEHYINLGGNSYIKNEVERLKKEGKL